MVKWPAACTPRKPAAKSPCMVFWNERIEEEFAIRDVMEGMVSQVEEASLAMSRLRQRGL